MKKILNIKQAIIGIAVAITVVSCSKKLDEKPYTVFTTEYFRTEEGIRSALVSVYSGMRYNYGPIGAMGISVMGTDEYTFGDQVTSSGDQMFQLGTYNIPPSNDAILTPWNRNFNNINMCNAILLFVDDVPIDEGSRNIIRAEARFLRALYYLLLVQQFGAVPLDLGSGELQFTSTANTEFYRLPTNEILVKNYQAMIEDLTFASQFLPEQRPANAFRLSQAVALHMLSKVYLFRAYSTAQQSTDFEQAYATATELINNQGRYGVTLLEDYGQVHRQGNDYNREVLYSVERLSMDNANNEVPDPGTDFANKVNIANNLFNANYQGTAVVDGMILIDDRPLEYGRPLRQFAPTTYIWEVAFAEKTVDSRYDNSFRRLWRVATLRTGAELEAYRSSLADVGFAIGDTAIYLANSNTEAAALRASGARYRVLGPSEYYSNQNRSNHLFPNLKKYDDTIRNNFNDVSGRPFIVSKLSETYLLAAEAAFQTGNAAEAANLINVIRRRAAYRPGLSEAELNSRRNAIEIGASDIDLDFILDERTRELCGESMRWPDLAMRNMLVDRVGRYNPDGRGNIQNFHLLRPIPQNQLNSLTDPDRAKYQNPGY